MSANRLGIPKPIAYHHIERLRRAGCTMKEIGEALGYDAGRVCAILKELADPNGKHIGLIVAPAGNPCVNTRGKVSPQET